MIEGENHNRTLASFSQWFIDIRPPVVKVDSRYCCLLRHTCCECRKNIFKRHMITHGPCLEV